MNSSTMVLLLLNDIRLICKITFTLEVFSSTSCFCLNSVIQSSSDKEKTNIYTLNVSHIKETHCFTSIMYICPHHAKSYGVQMLSLMITFYNYLFRNMLQFTGVIIWCCFFRALTTTTGRLWFSALWITVKLLHVLCSEKRTLLNHTGNVDFLDLLLSKLNKLPPEFMSLFSLSASLKHDSV